MSNLLEFLFVCQNGAAAIDIASNYSSHFESPTTFQPIIQRVTTNLSWLSNPGCSPRTLKMSELQQIATPFLQIMRNQEFSNLYSILVLILFKILVVFSPGFWIMVCPPSYFFPVLCPLFFITELSRILGVVWKIRDKRDVVDYPLLAKKRCCDYGYLYIYYHITLYYHMLFDAFLPIVFPFVYSAYHVSLENPKVVKLDQGGSIKRICAKPNVLCTWDWLTYTPPTHSNI